MIFFVPKRVSLYFLFIFWFGLVIKRKGRSKRQKEGKKERKEKEKKRKEPVESLHLPKDF